MQNTALWSITLTKAAAAKKKGCSCRRQCLVGGLAVIPKENTGHKFLKSSPGEAITDSLTFISSPINHLQLCYDHLLLWVSSVGHIGNNVSLETCLNDPNNTVCFRPLCCLECSNHQAVNLLKSCFVVYCIHASFCTKTMQLSHFYGALIKISRTAKITA